MTTLLVSVYCFCGDGEGGGGVPRAAGGQRAPGPRSGAAGHLSEGHRGPQDAAASVSRAVEGEKLFEDVVLGGGGEGG